MEPALARPRHEAVDHDDLLVHEWRVTRLTRLGIPWSVLTVNGQAHALRIEPRVSLLDALREHLGLTGSKKGCCTAPTPLRSPRPAAG
jgi:hypothetical protein